MGIELKKLRQTNKGGHTNSVISHFISSQFGKLVLLCFDAEILFNLRYKRISFMVIFAGVHVTF